MTRDLERTITELEEIRDELQSMLSQEEELLANATSWQRNNGETEDTETRIAYLEEAIPELDDAIYALSQARKHCPAVTIKKMQ
ncbi:MAG: hypothetical protein Q4F09_05445 [Erysipelotrichaceae bacterium]|nr:hypothetical protein [Erysipelotrichaceae bacterium]